MFDAVLGWPGLRRCESGAAGMSERNATAEVVREAGRGTSRERSEKAEPRFGACGFAASKKDLPTNPAISLVRFVLVRVRRCDDARRVRHVSKVKRLKG